MKPYYDRDGIQIFLGDAREIVPALDPVDLLLTDPPYGIGEAAGKNRTRGGPFGGKKNANVKSCVTLPTDFGDDSWDDEPVSPELIEAIRAKAKHQIIFGGNYYALPPTSCWLVWDKDNSGDFADAELAWTNLKKAVRLLKWRWNGMLQEHGGIHKEPRYHPTQKPLEVMRWALSHAPDSVETILDPFMGSGTTLIAAKEMGKRCIGIEREEKYVKAAIDRLAQGLLFTGSTYTAVGAFTKPAGTTNAGNAAEADSSV